MDEKNLNKESTENEFEFIELDLTKEDVDKMEDLINSLRNLGYAHTDLSSGKELVLSCKDFVKNREDYINNLKKLGLSELELKEHIDKINNLDN